MLSRPSRYGEIRFSYLFNFMIDFFFFSVGEGVFVILITAGFNCNWVEDEGRCCACCRETHYFSIAGICAFWFMHFLFLLSQP